ncbi:hypothetical protein RCL1_002452 [Eukaryota sp. TZLM3-RCL]
MSGKRDPLLESLTSKFRIVASDGSSVRVPRPRVQPLEECCFSFPLGDFSKTTVSLSLPDSILESFKNEFAGGNPPINVPQRSQSYHESAPTYRFPAEIHHQHAPFIQNRNIFEPLYNGGPSPAFSHHGNHYPSYQPLPVARHRHFDPPVHTSFVPHSLQAPYSDYERRFDHRMAYPAPPRHIPLPPVNSTPSLHHSNARPIYSQSFPPPQVVKVVQDGYQGYRTITSQETEVGKRKSHRLSLHDIVN